MTFESSLYTQISQAATLFDTAQRQFNTSANTKEAIDNATRSLDIYKACHSAIRRVKRRRSRANNGIVRNYINLELRMAMILRFLAAVSVAHAASDADATQQDHIRAAIQYHDEAVSLLVGVFEMVMIVNTIQ